MADSTTSSLTVSAPVADVLAVIADLPAYPDWNGEITHVQVLETLPGGRPRRARFAISSSGLSDEYELVYDWAPDGVGWQLAGPSQLQKSQVGSYRLVADGDATQVHYELRINSRLPLIGPMRRKIEKRIVDGALKELAARVAALR